MPFFIERHGDRRFRLFVLFFLGVGVIGSTASAAFLRLPMPVYACPASEPDMWAALNRIAAALRGRPGAILNPASDPWAG